MDEEKDLSFTKFIFTKIREVVDYTEVLCKDYEEKKAKEKYDDSVKNQAILIMLAEKMGLSVPVVNPPTPEPDIAQQERAPKETSRPKKKPKTKATTYFDSVELLNEEEVLYDEENI